MGKLFFDLIGDTKPMLELVKWWDEVGNQHGRNIRAAIIFGIIGTIYWYLIGLALSNLISLIKRFR